VQTYAWQPKSTMTDFEVLNSGRGPKIARGQGVGSVVIEMFGTWISLYYDRKEGLRLEHDGWNHSGAAEGVLRQNLGIGYALLVLAGDKAQHKYALKDPAALPTQAKTVFLPGLSPSLDHWVHEDEPGWSKAKEEEEESSSDSDSDNAPKEKASRSENAKEDASDTESKSLAEPTSSSGNVTPLPTPAAKDADIVVVAIEAASDRSDVSVRTIAKRSFEPSPLPSSSSSSSPPRNIYRITVEQTVDATHDPVDNELDGGAKRHKANP